jgi:hypothetical protein
VACTVSSALPTQPADLPPITSTQSTPSPSVTADSVQLSEAAQSALAAPQR